MREKSVARRYARALFNVVWKGGIYDEVKDQLLDFQSYQVGSPLAKAYLQSPNVPMAKKEAFLKALGENRGYMTVVVKFLVQIIHHQRLMIIPDIIELMEEMKREAQGVLKVSVRTATPLDERGRKKLIGSLQELLGRDIILDEAVTPGILGGFVIQVGSVYYDLSIAAGLRQLRQKILGEGAHDYRY